MKAFRSNDRYFQSLTPIDDCKNNKCLTSCLENVSNSFRVFSLIPPGIPSDTFHSPRIPLRNYVVISSEDLLRTIPEIAPGIPLEFFLDFLQGLLGDFSQSFFRDSFCDLFRKFSQGTFLIFPSISSLILPSVL